jgi:5-hydroxyisourate hydrolase
MRSLITTHILDTSLGKPVAGVTVTLERQDHGDVWKTIGRAVSNSDGRVEALLDERAALTPGIYRLTYGSGSYFHQRGISGFFPSIVVTFEIEDPSVHYHIPLLLSPFGYSTYRGS